MKIFFCIDRIQVGFQKGKSPDSDWLTITTSIHDNVIRGSTERQSITHHIGSDIRTGSTRHGPWFSRPVQLDDQQSVGFSYMISNLAARAAFIRATCDGVPGRRPSDQFAPAILGKSGDEIRALGPEKAERSIAEDLGVALEKFRNSSKDVEEFANDVKRTSAKIGRDVGTIYPPAGGVITVAGEVYADLAVAMNDLGESLRAIHRIVTVLCSWTWERI